MDDLVAFLRARLNEDEQAARSATPGPWTYNPGKMWLDGEAFEKFDRSKGLEFVSYGGPWPFVGCVAVTGLADHPQSMTDAGHIARHDPARVLREVEAKRLILRDLEQAELSLSTAGPGTPPHDLMTGAVNTLRRAVRLLAVPYADHPGYRTKWRP